MSTNSAEYKAQHGYKVVCISMYTRDVDKLGEMVAELKRRGLTAMSKSKLIRIALAQLDLERVTKEIVQS